MDTILIAVAVVLFVAQSAALKNVKTVSLRQKPFEYVAVLGNNRGCAVDLVSYYPAVVSGRDIDLRKPVRHLFCHYPGGLLFCHAERAVVLYQLLFLPPVC